MSADTEPVVLVVEDEPDVAESYQLWLSDDYEVRVTDSGAAALDALGPDVDVVLLDRMMPGLSGAEVLAEIHASDFDPYVAMVTAVDPDFDILEMGFDAYITKPPSRETLQETVAELLERDAYAETVREYRSLVAKRSALQAEKQGEELEASEAYQTLKRRIEELKADLEHEQAELLDDATFVGQLRDLAGGEDG
ncbi:response regulator [Haloarcula sp. CBA1130]|uniref:response regulator n=1 Tax=unclassified Haloarcula TaxID=2624677 RepID=UPI00124806D4|nr:MULTISPECIES: response regulator [unclassified Haloarcula]KAA9399538.1 response regulator [Haloarcula sp. CBA1129]KAA9401262.1 response regulator [Haloarcula sp. CBA1130]